MRDGCEVLSGAAADVLVSAGLEAADDSKTSWNSPRRSMTAPKFAMDSNCMHNTASQLHDFSATFVLCMAHAVLHAVNKPSASADAFVFAKQK